MTQTATRAVCGWLPAAVACVLCLAGCSGPRGTMRDDPMFGGTGQSAAAWNAGGGIGVAVSGVGPLTPLDVGTPPNQTNTISFNLNYWHQSGEVQGPGTATAPSGAFQTNTVLFTLTFGYRRPSGAF